MVAKNTAIMFLGKFVSLERFNGSGSIFSKGEIIEVKEDDLILKFNGTIQAYALDSIQSIREVGGESG